jgi:hypothetical protein
MMRNTDNDQDETAVFSWQYHYTNFMAIPYCKTEEISPGQCLFQAAQQFVPLRWQSKYVAIFANPIMMQATRKE